MASLVRLYVDHALNGGQSVPLAEAQAHYLGTVMRLGPGDALLAFNGRDGEWRVAFRPQGRRGGTLDCLAPVRPQGSPPDLWLVFAPLKKARTDFLVEKAVELGVSRLMPVQTDFTSAERLRDDRLRAHAVEAAEQCGATSVPEIAPLTALSRVLSGWDPSRRLWLCDEEAGAGPGEGRGESGGGVPRHGAGGAAAPAPAHSAFAGAGPGPAAIAIGPEGGFSPSERVRLRSLAFVSPVGLGPRILRAET
ncbi:MAG: 16S rRNA (uracil(1498)-N(3))-methyltransferase, partial [Pseudomonadota bacterium]